MRYRPQLVQFVEARLAVMKGDWNVAKAILVDVVPKLQDDPGVQKLAYLCLGQCYHQQGDTEKQITAYSQALEIDPYLVPARMGLAEIYMSRGNLPDADQQLQKLVKGPHPESEMVLALARIWIMMRLREDKEKRDWGPVDKLLDQIERQTSLTPSLAVLRAEVLLAKDLREPARDLLEKCAAKYSKSGQVWLALINLAMYQAERESDAGKKELHVEGGFGYIGRAEQTLGDHPIVREKRASCAVRRKDPQAITVLKKLGENVDKMTDLEKTRLWGSLAALSVQANDFELARLYCRLVAEKEPKNTLIRYLLCDLNLRVYEKGETPDLQELDQRLDEIEHLVRPRALSGSTEKPFAFSCNPASQTHNGSWRPAAICKMPWISAKIGRPRPFWPVRFARCRTNLIRHWTSMSVPSV